MYSLTDRVGADLINRPRIPDTDYPALLALEMQRQLNNFSPSLKVNLTRTRQGPVSMILNINNGNVA